MGKLLKMFAIYNLHLPNVFFKLVWLLAFQPHLSLSVTSWGFDIWLEKYCLIHSRFWTLDPVFRCSHGSPILASPTSWQLDSVLLSNNSACQLLIVLYNTMVLYLLYWRLWTTTAGIFHIKFSHQCTLTVTGPLLPTPQNLSLSTRAWLC